MKIALLTLSLLVSGLLFAQTECETRIADTLEYQILESAIQMPQTAARSDCNTIRVVVHVVYDGSIENTFYNGKISPEQVKSQIRITNQFFANDSLMQNEGATLGYQVQLANTDPEGNPTTGIIYHDGYALFGEAWSTYGLKNNNPNAISASTLASALSWGTDANGKKYLNSYVVSSIDGNTGGGVQAFAYFPTTSIVFANYNLYNAFGAEQLEHEYDQTFNLKSYTDLGHTWTHELLHNFAVYHTFEGQSCAAEANPLTQGDKVADTPPQTKGSGCSGACGTISYNVMDYLNQTCKFLITQGQVDRATTAIEQSLIHFLVCDDEVEGDDCDDKTSDFNDDGSINLLDVSLFSQSFGCSAGASCYNPVFDLNCDGHINVLDFSQIAF